MQARVGLVGVCVAFFLPGEAPAQDDPLEEIVVTGSRIARPDFESASPIVTVPAEVFAQIGSSTVESTLNLMPQFVPGLGATSNGIADGQATADLRGLGPSRTLVLIDGRRLVPSNGEGVPDLNMIPPSLVESVEVVTGGASATYGSDAIAGVVNFKLRDSFDGVEFGGRWGQTSHNDGQEYDVSITAGTSFADGRGSVMGFIGYSDRGQVNQGDRDFSNASLFYLGPGQGTRGPRKAYVPFGSRYIEEGAVYDVEPSDDAFRNLFSAYGYPDTPWQSSFGLNADGTLFTMGDFSPGSVANFRGTPDPLVFNPFVYFYNTATTTALQMPFERVSGFLSARYELGDSAEVYAQALIADYTVDTQFAPTPLQAVRMPVTNPYVPADLGVLLASRVNADDPFDFGKRMTVLGPRVQQNQYDTYEATVGARGTITGAWKYDAYLQFGESDQTKRQSGNVSRSRVEELTFAPDGGASICGRFDPFGVDTISAECAAYVSADASNHATVQETIFEATANGPLAALPAGDLRTVVGVQYRDQSYRYRAGNSLGTGSIGGIPDILGFDAAGEIDADDHNLDLYTEALVPLARDRPGLESLDLGLGYRYSDYASAGGVGTWKADLMYEPLKSLRIRGSYQRAVRAPSIYELYQPRLDEFADFFPDEPCGVRSSQRRGNYKAQVEALCVAQGLPEALLPTFRANEILVKNGGNVDLSPERANTYTAGIVFQPAFDAPVFDDLQVTVDWYRIDVSNAVLYVDATTAVRNCYDPTYNPAFAPTNVWCSTFGRDPVTGVITGAQSTYWNLASLSTSGIDTQLQWSILAGPGRMSVSWFVTWVASYEIQSGPSVKPEDFAGTVGGFGGSQPAWKWNLHVGYAIGGLTLGARWRYVDGMVDGGRYPDGIEAPRFDVTVPHYDYFDLEAAYEVRDGPLYGLTLRAGIENLADKDPPIFPSASVANTDASQYDVLGRRYFIGVEYRL